MAVAQMQSTAQEDHFRAAIESVTPGAGPPQEGPPS
jgi:hypothetical protein